MNPSPRSPWSLLAGTLLACAVPLSNLTACPPPQLDLESDGAVSAPPATSLPTPGPHPVGWRNEVMPFTGSTTIKNRIYYPALSSELDALADPGGGPYPLVALIHGATAAPSYYDVISHHVASHGYVVASLGKMSALHETIPNMAVETAELIDWVEEASADPGSPYAGLIWDGAFGLIGSSRGGGAAELVVGMEPRLAVVAEMEPRYHPAADALAALAAWPGTWLFIAGELDTTVPPAEVQQILAKATGSPRRLYVEILGAGHAGALDPDVPGLPVDPMPHEDQLSLHARMVLSVIEAVLRDDEDHFHDLVGGGLAGEPLVRESTCSDPPLWVVESGDPAAQVALGLAGAEGDLALLALSPGTATVPTQYGLVGLDLTQGLILPAVVLDATGAHELVLAVPAGLTGLEIHVQALVKAAAGGGSLSRTDLVIAP